MVGDETFVVFTFAWCCYCFELLIQAIFSLCNVTPVHYRCTYWSRACLYNGYRAVIGCDCHPPSNTLRAVTTLWIDRVRRRRRERDFTFVQNFAAHSGRNRQHRIAVKKKGNTDVWNCLYKRWDQLPQKGDSKCLLLSCHSVFYTRETSSCTVLMCYSEQFVEWCNTTIDKIAVLFHVCQPGILH